MIDDWEDEIRSAGFTEGGIEMVERIRATLQVATYREGVLITPNGGDEVIMAEVQRLCRQAIASWYAEGQR
jgi:hypothetical protein